MPRIRPHLPAFSTTGGSQDCSTLSSTRTSRILRVLQRTLESAADTWHSLGAAPTLASAKSVILQPSIAI